MFILSDSSFLWNLIKNKFPFIDGIQEVYTECLDGIYIHPHSFTRAERRTEGDIFQILTAGAKLTEEMLSLLKNSGAKLIREEKFIAQNENDKRNYTSYEFVV